MSIQENKVWVIRAGRNGEQEQFALDNNCVVIGYPQLSNLADLSPGEMHYFLARDSNQTSRGEVQPINVHQPLNFRDKPRKGELVLLPLKIDRGYVAIGEITGDYEYHGEAKDGWTRHRRPVQWLDKYFRRDALPKDIQSSLQSELTIFTPNKPDAAARIRALLKQ